MSSSLTFQDICSNRVVAGVRFKIPFKAPELTRTYNVAKKVRKLVKSKKYYVQQTTVKPIILLN